MLQKKKNNLKDKLPFHAEIYICCKSAFWLGKKTALNMNINIR